MPANTDLFSGFEPAYELSERSMMREVIAQRLWQSKNEMPHFYVSLDVDMTAVNALRTTFKVQDLKISVNDFVLKATATGSAYGEGSEQCMGRDRYSPLRKR